MSTRCNIGFYDQKPASDELDSKVEAMIYRHSDGYPEGVLSEIMPFLKEWDTKRGMSDTEYTAARLLAYLCDLHKGELGYGISKERHRDIAFYYAVYPTEDFGGFVDCYAVENKWCENDTCRDRHQHLTLKDSLPVREELPVKYK